MARISKAERLLGKGEVPREPEREEAARMARLVRGGGFNWEFGEEIAWEVSEADRARFRWEMECRYAGWAEREPVCYTASKYESAVLKPAGVDGMEFLKWHPLEVVNPVDVRAALPEAGWDEKRGKARVPKNVYDANVLSRRRFLYEIDGMALADQKALLEPLLRGKVIQRVVYSGNKSLHCVVEETDEPEPSAGEEEYKYAFAWIAYHYFGDKRYQALGLPARADGREREVIDANCGHPSRTTRTPFALRKDEKTGWKAVEQRLLYFEYNRLSSGWREGYERARKRRDAEAARARERARRAGWQNRERGKKTPNEAARRFIGGDMSDGWKHANVESAAASLSACGYSREEAMAIFERYRYNQDGKKSDIAEWGMKCFDYFQGLDAAKAYRYFAGKNGESLAAEAAL
jgi:hypothetical protein